jgi:spore maturation protein CgeB
MRFVIFCHSLISDWNHGNAHFLRGVVTELLESGHGVDVYEPEDGWSRRQLIAERGEVALVEFATRFPRLRSRRYLPGGPDLDRVLADADVVLVHEWTDPALVAAIGAHRASRGQYRLLYHDTHHRAVSDRAAWETLELASYDAALVFGRALAEVYRRRPSIQRVFVWHEAADVRTFRPGARGALFEPLERAPVSDLVWIGNWGDDERTADDLRRALPPTGPGRARARRRRLPRVPPEPRRAGRVRARARHDPRPAALLRDGAAGHPDDTTVRGARLRHPARLGALGRRRAPLRARP